MEKINNKERKLKSFKQLLNFIWSIYFNETLYPRQKENKKLHCSLTMPKQPYLSALISQSKTKFSRPDQSFSTMINRYQLATKEKREKNKKKLIQQCAHQ